MSVRGWELIDTQVLSGTASSVSFNPVSDEYRRFMLVAYVIPVSGSNALWARVNGDTGANYSRQNLYATSATIAGARGTGDTKLSFGAGLGTDATPGVYTLMLSKPAAGVVARAVATTATTVTNIVLEINAHEWTNTAALISSITLLMATGNMAAGTRVSCWGSRR